MSLSLEHLRRAIHINADDAMYWGLIYKNPLSHIYSTYDMEDPELIERFQNFVSSDHILVYRNVWVEDSHISVNLGSLFRLMFYYNTYLMHSKNDKRFQYKDIVENTVRRITELVLFMLVKYPLIFCIEKDFGFYCKYSVDFFSMIESHKLKEEPLKSKRDQLNGFIRQQNNIAIDEIKSTLRGRNDLYRYLGTNPTTAIDDEFLHQ